MQRREYTFNNPAATPQMLTFEPAPIIIVEGIFVFHFPEINRLLDLKVFVDAKEHLKLHRRILRDIDERGFSLEDVLYKYTHQVVPAYEKYIAPYQHDADLIIPNNQELKEDECPLGAELLATYLKNKISSYVQTRCNGAAFRRRFSAERFRTTVTAGEHLVRAYPLVNPFKAHFLRGTPIEIGTLLIRKTPSLCFDTPSCSSTATFSDFVVRSLST